MHLFFDFDGTLADSSPGIYLSFELACKSLDLTAPVYEEFRDNIGPPVQLLARRFFPELSEEQVESFRQTFRQDYDTVRFRECQWYEGVMPTLQSLVDLGGTTLAIITNKPTRPTVELLSSAKLINFFELVVGIDYQVMTRKGQVFANKAEAITFAHSQLTECMPGAIYIGDTPSDRKASHDCGLGFIAATYGFHRWQVAELGASNSISQLSDLIPLLLESRSLVS